MRRNAGGGDYATGADRAALLRSIDDQLSSLAAHGARHNSVMDLATVTVKASRRQRGIWVSVSADLVEKDVLSTCRDCGGLNHDGSCPDVGPDDHLAGVMPGTWGPRHV